MRPKPKTKPAGPQGYQKKQREWAIEAEAGFAQAAVAVAAYHRCPRTPGEHVEEPGKSNLPAGATRQDDGLEGIEQYSADSEQSED